jgi:antitoxin (DNA-binding transcriptional repressor) of toxin-antitoxin stability system
MPDEITTRNGIPVAHIGPIQPADGTRRLNTEQERVLADSLARLRNGWPLGIDRLNRDELYDDARQTTRAGQIQNPEQA